MVEEARLGDFKRLSTRNFMALKLGGLLEFGEKATVSPFCINGFCRWGGSPPCPQIVGELGKLLIEVWAHFIRYSVYYTYFFTHPLGNSSRTHTTWPAARILSVPFQNRKPDI